MRVAFSINQTIKRSLHPFACRSINQSINQSINRTNLAAKRSFSSTNPAKLSQKQSFEMSKFRVGLCQFHTVDNKAENLKAAEQSINEAINRLNALSNDQSIDQSIDQPRMIVLPEMFNCPYSNDKFPEYAEVLSDDQSIDSPTAQFLREQAKKHNVFIVGGSIPELVPSTKQIFNTCLIVNNTGDIIGKHRKIHLFDIDIPNKIKFCESDILSAGNSLTSFEVPSFGKIGVGICYDIRFSEYALLLRDSGCKMLVYPGAFNMTTGPLHWELLARGRAVDNQLYVAVCSPARAKDTTGYVAWGHSTIVDPWGKVIASTEHEPDVVVAELDVTNVNTVRENIPISKQMRTDIYQLKQV